MKKNNSLRILVQCALFIALAVALYSVSYMIPIGGAAGLRIGFSGIFKKIPCLLFGPWYGAAVCGITDILGYLVAPQGAYIPLLTLVYVFQGFMIGFLFKYINKMWKKDSFIVLLIKLFIVFSISDIIMTVLSSLTLMIFVPALMKKGFVYVFVPRLVEEIVSIFICTYIDACLIRVYNRIEK